jgi:hypothetical protein
MTLPRTVADVLSRHVAFEIECIDRMYLNVYVPGLQSVAGAVWFCRTHLGQPYASTALLEPISRRFLAAIRDNLDLGRPDRVGLVFGRQVYRNSRHRFRTRVVTDGVTPSLHIDYKHCTIKQYHKLGRALRTETTINDAGDFYLKRRLCHLPALRQVGQQANRRLLDIQRLTRDPTTGAEALAAITAPIDVDGQHAPALRFGDPRAHALLSALPIFRLQPGGLTNADLRAHVAELLHTNPADWHVGRMTYDLRRLRLQRRGPRRPPAPAAKYSRRALCSRSTCRVRSQIIV